MEINNGWSRYEELVLFRLTSLEAATDSERRKAEERHQCLLAKVNDLHADVTELKAGRRVVWLKVAGLAFAVAAATSFGGKALWDLVLKGLF